MPPAVSWTDAAFSKCENNFLKKLSCDVSMQFAFYRITSSSVGLKWNCWGGIQQWSIDRYRRTNVLWRAPLMLLACIFLLGKIYCFILTESCQPPDLFTFSPRVNSQSTPNTYAGTALVGVPSAARLARNWSWIAIYLHVMDSGKLFVIQRQIHAWNLSIRTNDAFYLLKTQSISHILHINPLTNRSTS